MSIHQIVFSSAFKILIGVVLFAAMIISLLSLSQDLHTYLGSFENGNLLQLGSSILLLVFTATGLFFLMVDKKDKTDTDQTHPLITALGIKFLEGFIRGLLKETNKKQTGIVMPSLKKEMK